MIPTETERTARDPFGLRVSRRAVWAAVVLLGLSVTPGCADRSGEGETPTSGPVLYRLHVGGRALEVELAATPAARRDGLMFRTSVPRGRGMLFVFKEAELLSFWMRNTLVPLDVAFADETGRIFQIERMEAESEEAHESTRPARYALEVPAGWFRENGITAGAVMELSESIRRLPVE